MEAPMRIYPTPEQRFWSKVDPCRTDGCWIWCGWTDRKGGYALFYAETQTVLVHRWAYEHFMTAIPVGYEIDHVKTRGCNNRSCVYPGHLEPVKHLENQRRGFWSSRLACSHGHEYTLKNLRIINGKRVCRECARLASVRRRQVRLLADPVTYRADHARYERERIQREKRA